MCVKHSITSKVVSYGPSCTSFHESHNDYSFMDTAVGWEGADNIEKEESFCSVDPVPQPQRLSSSIQSRQITDSAEESHRIVDPVPQSRRLSSSRQSRQSAESAEESHRIVDPVPQPRRLSRQLRQSADSMEEAESHPTIEPVEQPLRRSSREPRRRTFSTLDSDSDDPAPSSSRKTPRRSESPLARRPHRTGDKMFWTPAMV